MSRRRDSPRRKDSPRRSYSTRSKRSQEGRSSERLKKKSLREFVLPDKDEILANLVPEGTPTKNYRHLRPRKLVNELVKGRNRYNNPDGIDLFDDSELSDFVADDNEEEERRQKRRRSRKRKESSASSEWENSEGSAFSESDDVLDDEVHSDVTIDSEDEDGGSVVDVVSEEGSTSETDVESISSTEEFMQKHVKKSLKKIPKRVTSSTWWKTNKGPLSKSSRKRRALKRTQVDDESDDSPRPARYKKRRSTVSDDEGDSDDSEESPRPAKHKKRRSTISDDEDDDDDERPSYSRARRNKAKKKERHVKKRRPKAKRAPVIDDEDDTDEEEEHATPADPKKSEERENTTKGKKERNKSSSDEENQSDNPTSTNENNGDSPKSVKVPESNVRRRMTRRGTVPSSDESETERLKSSTSKLNSEKQDDGNGNSSDTDDVVHVGQSSPKHHRIGLEKEEEVMKLQDSQDDKSSGDVAERARHGIVARNDDGEEDVDSSATEGNDVNALEDNDIDEMPQNSESNDTNKELVSSKTVENESESSQNKASDLGERTEADCSLPTNTDDKSNEKSHCARGPSLAELVGDESEAPDDIYQQVSFGTDKEAQSKSTAQEVIENEAVKDNECVNTDAKKETNDICETVQVQNRIETQDNTAKDSSKTDTKDVTISESVNTGGAVKDATENVSKAEEDYDSDDSIVECPVPPKTPPPEITLSSDEEEPEPPASTNSTSGTNVNNPFSPPLRSGASFTGNPFGQVARSGFSFGENTRNSPFQQTFDTTDNTNSTTGNIAAALSRSGASFNSNPFGQVLNSGYMMQGNIANNHLQQTVPTTRTSGTVANNQAHNFPTSRGASGVLNNLIQQQSLFDTNAGNEANQRQSGQNQAWGNWPQVTSNQLFQSAQRQQMGVNSSGDRSEQRMSLMPGTSATGHHSGISMMSGTSTSHYQSGQTVTTMSSTSTSRTGDNQSTQEMNARIAQIRSELLSGTRWGRTPNTVRQNVGQTWGRTPNTADFQSSRFSSQVMRSNNNNQRFQTPSRLEILGVQNRTLNPQNTNSVDLRTSIFSSEGMGNNSNSSARFQQNLGVQNNRMPNPGNSQELRNRLQSSRNCLQPSSFTNDANLGNAQTEQRTQFSGNSFNMGVNNNRHQQSYPVSSNQLPNRTLVQNNNQTSQSGFGDFRPSGFGMSTEQSSSTVNLQPQFVRERNLSSSDNQNTFPGPVNNGVTQNFPGTTHHMNIPAVDRLKSFANRIPTSIQLQQQRQQYQQQQQHQHQQNMNQNSATNNVTYNTQLNKWVLAHPGSGSIQQPSFSSVLDQTRQNATSQFGNSMRSAANVTSIRPSSFHSPTLRSRSSSGEMQQGSNIQQPMVSTSISNTFSPAVNTGAPNFGSANDAQIFRAQNPAVSLPASFKQNTFQQVGGSAESMSHLVQDAYQHLHNKKKTFDRAHNNIEENINAMRQIQQEMKSMTSRSSTMTARSSTKEISVFSQTIISEVSSVQSSRSSVESSTENLLPDIHNLHPSPDGLDPVGGNMLTDINDAVLASIADEEPVETANDDPVLFTLDDPANQSLLTIEDKPLITLHGGDETGGILHSSRNRHGMSSGFGLSSGNSPQRLTSREHRGNPYQSSMNNPVEQPIGAPVVILQDILSQIKTVRFDQPSGRSLRLHTGRGGDRPVDISPIRPGKKFLIKENSDENQVDIIEKSTNAIIVLGTKRARLTEKAKQILGSKDQDEEQHSSSLVTKELDTNTSGSRIIGEKQKNCLPSSVLNSAQDSTYRSDISRTNVGSNERLNPQTISNNNSGGVKLHPAPAEDQESNSKKSALDILPVV